MLLVLQLSVLVLLSWIPGADRSRDPYGLQPMVEDRKLRSLLLEGRFQEYELEFRQRLAGSLAARLSAENPKAPRPGEVERLLARGGHQLEGLVALLRGAVQVAGFVTELQALGPATALREALRWVETGLVRKSEVPRELFSSFGKITTKAGRPGLDAEDEAGLAADLGAAGQQMNQSYARILALFQPSLL